MLTVTSGFTKAEIETNDTCATATVEIASNDLIEEMDKTLVHILVEPETYWSAADLYQLADYLNIVANELGRDAGDVAYDEL